jgi:sulfite exporter TauE/SafE
MDYWLSFLAGFFGSMHCVGMCGAIVLAYSTQDTIRDFKPLSTLPAHLVYNIGRVAAYTFVGGIFGFIGGGITSLKVVAQGFTLVMGFILLIIGILSLKIFPQLQLAGEDTSKADRKKLHLVLYKNIFGKLIGSQTIESKFYIGLFTPLLPCGLSYAMFLKAASTASFVSGAMVTFFFGLGIAPALLVAGIASSFFGYRLRKIGDKLATITIILMGMMMIIKSLAIHLH